MEKLLQQEKDREQFMKGYADYLGKTLKEQNQQIIDIASNIQETFSVLKNKILNAPIMLESSQYSSELLNEEKGETVMKGITKRKDGRYMIRKTVNGVPIVKYAHTKEEARQIYVDIKRGKIKPKKKQKVGEPTKYIRVGEYADYWLETYKKPFIKLAGYRDIKSFINRFSKEYGNEFMRDIKTEHLQEFFNSMERSRTKEKIVMYICAMFEKAYDTNVILRNPCKNVIKDKKVKCKHIAFVFAEQQKIVKAVKGTDIEHEVITYLMCGCRPAELPTSKQFDFENNLLNINGTKNDNAEHRIIEMSNQYAEYMQAYFKNKEMQPWQYVSKQFINLCESLGINKGILYRLRHTFASNHFRLKTQVKYIQEWLGHGSISITLDTYTDIDKTATKEKILELYNNYYYIP